MASSGVTTFEFQVWQIIEHAYLQGAGLDPQDLGFGQYKRARELLQLIIADWENKTDFPWKQDYQSLTLIQGLQSVSLGSDTVDIIQAVYSPPPPGPGGTPGNDIPMLRIALGDYLNIPDKTTQGRPDRYCLRRDIPAPTLFLWQTPDGANLGFFNYYRIKQTYDVTASQQTMDIAKRWAMAVVKRLAYELMPYVIALKDRGSDYQNERSVKRGEMDDAFEAASTEDRETATTGIYPEGWDPMLRTGF